MSADAELNQHFVKFMDTDPKRIKFGKNPNPNKPGLHGPILGAGLGIRALAWESGSGPEEVVHQATENANEEISLRITRMHHSTDGWEVNNSLEVVDILFL